MENRVHSSEQCIPRIKKAITLVEAPLETSTGHDDYQRRKIAYYAVATHFIDYFDPFPGLAIYGPPGTGKSATLIILRRICRKVVAVTIETITDAALKACMKEADHGTLIIEEADAVTDRELENMLVTRYSKSSADLKKMVKGGDDWVLAQYATFGATIVHRRNLFRDPAMLRRVITVQTKRTKKEFSQLSQETLNKMFRLFDEQLSVIPKLPDIKSIWNIEPATLDCYKPLVAIAEFIEDKNFLNLLIKEMRDASSRLVEEEAYLEPSLLLRAILTLVSGKIKDKVPVNLVNIEISSIEPALRSEYGATCTVFRLTAVQRNRIIRDDLHFLIKSSGGKNRVCLTIPDLIQACDNYGIQDESLNEWKEALDLNESENKKGSTDMRDEGDWITEPE